MSTSEDPYGTIVLNVKEVYEEITDNYITIEKDELRNKIDKLIEITLKNVDKIPDEDKEDIIKYIFTKLFEMARTMSYIERDEMLIIIYNGTMKLYQIVNTDTDMIWAIRTLVKNIDTTKTFRDVLTWGDKLYELEKYEKKVKENNDN